MEDDHPASSPLSVLRQRGSSSCLRAYLEDSSDESPQASNKITVVNTKILPHYSTERYYVLSEIAQKAYYTDFLCEWNAAANAGSREDDTLETEPSSASEDLESIQSMNHGGGGGGENQLEDAAADPRNNTNATISSQETNNTATLSSQQANYSNVIERIPPFLILYILWKPSSPYFTAPLSFAEYVIKPYITKILDTYNAQVNQHDGTSPEEEADYTTSIPSAPKIYIVIERVCPERPQIPAAAEESSSRDLDQLHQENWKLTQTELAEELVKTVSAEQSLGLRHLVEGVMVGVSDNVRAAPGLEACMDAIQVGDAERRLLKKKKPISKQHTENYNMCTFDPTKSCIGLIAFTGDDLTGMDDAQETDAVQGLTLHLRTNGEFSKKGNILNFAVRAQEWWRQRIYIQYVKDEEVGTLWEHCDLENLVNKYRSFRRKKRRRSKQLSEGEDNEEIMSKYFPSKQTLQRADHISNVMIAILLGSIVSYYWNLYGDEVLRIGQRIRFQFGV